MGGPGDQNIGSSPAALSLLGFIRHPTSQVTIGACTPQGYDCFHDYGGGHDLSRYVSSPTKVKVYASDRVGFTDASPGCVSCHKAHGNRNAFGLIFMQGTGTLTDDGDGGTYVDLCRQCHTEGANGGGGSASVNDVPLPQRSH